MGSFHLLLFIEVTKKRECLSSSGLVAVESQCLALLQPFRNHEEGQLADRTPQGTPSQMGQQWIVSRGQVLLDLALLGLLY